MKNRLDRYKNNLDLRKAGKFPGLPLHLIFKKLGETIPSIPRETTIIMFAPTNAGKTQLWKRITLNLALLHLQKKTNTKPLFIVNLLEESLEEFEDSIVSMLYYDYYQKDIISNKKQRVSKMKLNSYTKERLSDEEFRDIKENINPLVNKILSTYYKVRDDLYNPYGMYNNARNISYKVGTHTYTKLIKTHTIPDITHEQYAELPKERKKLYKWSKYTLNDENLYPIVITDHLELISPEKGKTKWESMRDWSFEFGRKQISKNWKWIIINILQATSESQKKQFNFKNELNWDALKLTLDSISANKVIAQDHHIIWGLFDPNRYSVNGEIDGIDLELAKGKYRSITTLKNRIGPSQTEIPLYFDGSSAVFKEINLKNLPAFYNLCKT